MVPGRAFCGFLIVDVTRFLLCVGMLHLLEVFEGFTLLLLRPWQALYS